MGDKINRTLQKAKVAIKHFIMITLVKFIAESWIKILAICLVLAVGGVLLDWAREGIDGKNTADKIEEVLSVQDINELIEIKGNDED